MKDSSGDYNGDGKADLLWQNATTGDVAIWQVDGTVIATSAIIGHGPAGSGWALVNGHDDYNGDGNSDLLWQNSASGDVAVWTLNGTTLTGAAIIGNAPGDWILNG
jgi:hypothetical protein